MNPVASLPNLVRQSCTRVCESAALVALNPDRLASIGSELLTLAKRDGSETTTDVFGNPSRKDTSNPEVSMMRERSSLLIFALDAINFGSGYHDIVDKRPELSGARSMEANLREFDEREGPLTPDVLRTLSDTRCATIFRQEMEGSRHAEGKAELMALFSSAFSSLAAWLDTYDGKALHAIEAANGSAVTLATMLLEMPFYRDKADHFGAPVHFYKRAQITPADLQRELGEPLFNDLDKLTAFADNLVPHVLRIDGAIILDRRLEKQINSGKLLPAGSPAEIEIRAAGIEAVRLLAQLTGRTETDLDLLLWTQGSQPKYKQVPRHRCRTVFY